SSTLRRFAPAVTGITWTGRPGSRGLADRHRVEWVTGIRGIRNLPRRHAGDVHLRHRKLQRPLRPEAFLQRLRIKSSLSNLRDGQRELAHSCLHRLRLVAVRKRPEITALTSVSG